MAARKSPNQLDGKSKRATSTSRAGSNDKTKASRASTETRAETQPKAGTKKNAGRVAPSARQKPERRTPVPSGSRQNRRRTPILDEKGWRLRLYVAGDSPRSRLALSNLRRLCEERIKGDYEIEVIDLTKLPHLAKADQILAVPTLIRSIPEPMKRIIGDLSDADRALVALDLTPARKGPS